MDLWAFFLLLVHMPDTCICLKWRQLKITKELARPFVWDDDTSYYICFVFFLCFVLLLDVLTSMLLHEPWLLFCDVSALLVEHGY